MRMRRNVAPGWHLEPRHNMSGEHAQSNGALPNISQLTAVGHVQFAGCALIHLTTKRALPLYLQLAAPTREG
jgi:hypothetical protein